MTKLRAIRGGKSPKFECISCHAELTERETLCPACGQFDTVVRQEDEISPPPEKKREPRPASRLSYHRPRFYSSGCTPLDHVLGGGLVRKSSVLLYGSKGTGKSTKAIAVACHVARLTKSVALYGSAEMPADFVRMYADRIGMTRSDLSRLFVQDSSDALDLLENIEQLRPSIVIWDSIQRFSWEGERGETELKQVVCHALDAARAYNHVAMLLSQVTKEDVFIGESGIGHDVDVMVKVSREETLIRYETPEKNRFAETPLSACEPFGPRDTAEASPVTIDSEPAVQEWLARSARIEDSSKEGSDTHDSRGPLDDSRSTKG